MSHHRVVAIECGDDWMGQGRVIGTASSEAEAVAMMRREHPTTIVSGEGGTVDFYDAEDAPGVFGIDADGTGAWGVTYMTTEQAE